MASMPFKLGAQSRMGFCMAILIIQLAKGSMVFANRISHPC